MGVADCAEVAQVSVVQLSFGKKMFLRLATVSKSSSGNKLMFVSPKHRYVYTNSDASLKKSRERPSDACKNLCLRGEINELGLPGFHRLFSQEISRTRRLVWATLCFLILSVCIYQSFNRIEFFFHGPPSVYVHYVRNRSITFPAVTVCPGNPQATNPAVWPSLLKEITNSNVVYKTSYDLLDHVEMNVSTLWKISRIPISNLTYVMSLGVSLNEGFQEENQNINLSTQMTTCGICTTITPTKEVPHHGIFTYLLVSYDVLKLHEDEDMLWRFMVHPLEDMPLIRYMVAYEGVQAIFGKIVYSAHRIEREDLLSTLQSPCTDGYEYTLCIVKCLQKLIFSKITGQPCRLPYMIEDGTPDCATPEEFKKVFAATSQVMDGYHDSQCPCYRKCRTISYPFETIVERQGDSNASLNLHVFFPENRISVVSEQKVYNCFALFSDIGGGLGLFLGMCIFHFLELAEILFTRLQRYCFNR